jgi:hypothetical protein
MSKTFSLPSAIRPACTAGFSDTRIAEGVLPKCVNCGYPVKDGETYCCRGCQRLYRLKIMNRLDDVLAIRRWHKSPNGYAEAKWWDEFKERVAVRLTDRIFVRLNVR